MKIIFMGTPDFAEATVEALAEAGHDIILCVTQPDRPKGRGGKMVASSVKEWALLHQVPVFQPQRIRKEEAISEIKKYEVDLIVVAAFGQILPKEILEFPRFGCINVHASLLPRYRGAAPIQWSILNGDKTTGITMIQMGEGLDDGNILSQQEVEILPEDTGGSLFERLAVIGGTLCVQTIENMSQGKIIPMPQDESKATHVGMIKKELGCLDFNKPAEEILLYIRGLNPWPSAYGICQDTMIKIWKARLAESDISAQLMKQAFPGKIVVINEKIYVCAKDACIEILELQAQGKKRMLAQDYLRGHAFYDGDFFAGKKDESL